MAKSWSQSSGMPLEAGWWIFMSMATQSINGDYACIISRGAPRGYQLGTFFVNGECACSPFVTKSGHADNLATFAACVKSIYGGRF